MTGIIQSSLISRSRGMCLGVIGQVDQKRQSHGLPVSREPNWTLKVWYNSAKISDCIIHVLYHFKRSGCLDEGMPSLSLTIGWLFKVFLRSSLHR